MMDKVKLAIQSGKVQDGDVLFEQLSSIQSNDVIEKISPEQFAELSEMVFLFQDDWMDNPLDYFQTIKDFLKVLDFEVLDCFPADFDLWYYYYAPEQKYEPTIASYALFTAPKLDSDGNVYNCLLSLERAEAYVQKAVGFAKSRNIQIPENEYSFFKVNDGLDVLGEKIYSQIGTERVVYKAIQHLQALIAKNSNKTNVVCLRRFAATLKIWIKNELSKEIYLTNCSHGKIADLLDRPETWDEFAAKHSN